MTILIIYKCILFLNLSFLSKAQLEYITVTENVVRDHDIAYLTDKINIFSSEINDRIEEFKNVIPKEKSIQTLQKYIEDFSKNLLREVESNNRLTVRMENSFNSSIESIRTDISFMKRFIQTEMKELRNILNSNSTYLPKDPLPEDCQDLYDTGMNTSGTYFLPKFDQNVVCDMETDGGGWLVIQRRMRVSPQVSSTSGIYS